MGYMTENPTALVVRARCMFQWTRKRQLQGTLNTSHWLILGGHDKDYPHCSGHAWGKGNWGHIVAQKRNLASLSQMGFWMNGSEVSICNPMYWMGIACYFLIKLLAKSSKEIGHLEVMPAEFFEFREEILQKSSLMLYCKIQQGKRPDIFVSNRCNTP